MLVSSPPVLVGHSAVMQRIRQVIERVARSELPVLIQGPTGSGKELVAQSIHAWSAAEGRCVAVNVCAIAEPMFEATLFGHVRGAFTGAHNSVDGLLSQAAEGSLFLDEISGLGLGSQATLLRALETGIFRPVGAASDRWSAFRVISASNERLSHLVANRQFRADLLHRLSGALIDLPPLRDRTEDIKPLTRHFLNLRAQVDTYVSIDDGALSALEAHPWPGNVRELKHVIDRAVVLSGRHRLRREDIEHALRSGETNPEPTCASRAVLIRVLKQSGWDTSATAMAFGVHRGTIYRWLKRFQIDLPARAATPLGRSLSGQG